MSTKNNIKLLIFSLTLAFTTQITSAQEHKENWPPAPPIITPGATNSDAPSDAIILFNGKNLDQWISAKDGSPARWPVSGGVFTVNKSAGDIKTKQYFSNYQLHIEWKIPATIKGDGQARGNSGIFLAVLDTGFYGYELQVLDSYNNKTYPNGQAGSIYLQYVPLVNVSRKPGEWQTYDVVWTAPTFNDDSTVKTPARVTILHNGVLVQNNVSLLGTTLSFFAKPSYRKHGPARISLQAHGDPSEPISYRNIWIRNL